MEYEWDDSKAEANRIKHGVPFDHIVMFEWETALIEPDNRKDYGEKRFKALGNISGRLHSVIFTVRHGRIRLIGLRKANQREQRYYDNTKEA